MCTTSDQLGSVEFVVKDLNGSMTVKTCDMESKPACNMFCGEESPMEDEEWEEDGDGHFSEGPDDDMTDT